MNENPYKPPAVPPVPIEGEEGFFTHPWIRYPLLVVATLIVMAMLVEILFVLTRRLS